MKPIKLTVQGFLTFRDPAEVDFRELYEEGIFLIAGPTGSGKTSLFDAISFALYGEAPTSGRKKPQDLRSDLSGPNDPMSVEFEFEAAQRCYSVKRWQKGADKAVQQRLVIDGDEVSAKTKVKEIQETISDVLGLSADQFSKIVMLPQGEFQSFLVASSKDKSEILRKLFDTEHYAGLRDRIRDKLNLIYGQVRDAQKIIDDHKGVSERADAAQAPREIQGILREECEAAKAKLSDLDKELRYLRGARENLAQRLENGKKLNMDLDRKAQLEEELAQAVAREPGFRAAEAKADQLNGIRSLAVQYDNLQEAQADLRLKSENRNSCAEALTKSRERLVGVSAQYQKNPQRQLRLSAMAKELDALDTRIKELKELSGLETEEHRESLALQELAEKLKQSEELRGERQTLTEKLEEASLLELRLTAEHTALREQWRDQNDFLNILRDYQTLLKDIEKNGAKARELTAELDQWRQEEARARADLLDLKQRFDLQGLASFSHLVREDAPCPLCGSLHHPAPFQKASALSKQEVRKAEEHAQKLREKVIKGESLGKQLEEIREELETKRKAYEEQYNREDLLQDKAAYETALKNLEEIGVRKKRDLEECRVQSQQLKTRRTEVEGALSKLDGVKAEYEGKHQALAILRSKMAVLSQKLGAAREDETQAEMTALQMEGKSLEKAIKAAEKAFHEETENKTRLETSLQKTEEELGSLVVKSDRLKQRITDDLARMDLSEQGFLSLKGELSLEETLRKGAREFFAKLQNIRTRLEDLQASLQGQQRLDLEELDEQILALVAEITRSEAAQQEAIRRETKLRSALDKVSAAAEVYETRSRELEVARKLDNTTGKGTTFENYVLGYYLDGVLLNANVRLRKMTAERFSLLRQAKDSGDQRAIEGLNINVFDTYSNTQRDVKTLSGGESFKASLAMALGLSDFIQENRSGIRLDTIFIDEGFGSLDQESLDSAMETILEIHGQGRLVGIISHVEELKERIPTQLSVRNNGPSGSSLRIIKG